jgi:hypothetical protein
MHGGTVKIGYTVSCKIITVKEKSETSDVGTAKECVVRNDLYCATEIHVIYWKNI